MSSVGQKIKSYADLKKHVYRAGDDTAPINLQPLHPITALRPSVLGRTGRIHGHITLSPSEYLKLFDALEGTLNKEAVQGMEPSKVHGLSL